MVDVDDDGEEGDGREGGGDGGDEVEASDVFRGAEPQGLALAAGADEEEEEVASAHPSAVVSFAVAPPDLTTSEKATVAAFFEAMASS